jgi:putative membrane protein
LGAWPFIEYPPFIKDILMRYLKIFSAGAVVTALLASASWAASTTPSQSSLEAVDKTFLDRAAQGSHMEIAGSKAAQQTSENPAVKQFAGEMIKDHSAMSDEVSALAASKNHTLPTEPSPEQKAELEKLNELSGKAFDTAYAQRVGVAAHEKTVSEFKQAVQEVKDPDVKALAEKTLPKLEHHLEMARELNSDPSLSTQ